MQVRVVSFGTARTFDDGFHNDWRCDMGVFVATERRAKVEHLRMIENKLRTVYAEDSTRHVPLRLSHEEATVLLEAIKTARQEHNDWIYSIENDD